jgi:hypothetical protein
MRYLTSGLRASLIAAILGVLLALPASAAHNGNNRADLAGDGITGRSVANYIAGSDKGAGESHTHGFNVSAQVRGLDAGAYTLQVRSPNGQVVTPVCDFVATGRGSAGCQENLDLGGFLTAEIADAAGTVVASGVYDRAGNCRDPQQAGTQCEANATRQNLTPM